MRVIAFLEVSDVIKKILNHLYLWLIKRKSRFIAHDPSVDAFPSYDDQPGRSIDDSSTDSDNPAKAIT